MHGGGAVWKVILRQLLEAWWNSGMLPTVRRFAQDIKVNEQSRVVGTFSDFYTGEQSGRRVSLEVIYADPLPNFMASINLLLHALRISGTHTESPCRRRLASLRRTP